ncbi:alpha/beta fold hydrolase [Litchfieldella rifensis]|uniref:Alpha/beta fold hydrolase n=1 Tax=Litchfieldella rifensis TaxID=762643 RepID=A0ABV7LUD0_9GAMM
MSDSQAGFRFEGRFVHTEVIGEGPPLVAIHGTPFSSQVWRRVVPHFREQRRIYLFDLLGYGRSEKTPGQDVSLGVQNRLLAALFEHWRLQAPDVLAHDFGGATALRGHLLNGLEYRSLTLVDPVALSPWGSPFVQHVRQHEAAFRGLPPYIHDALLRAYLQGAAWHELPEDALRIHCQPWLGEEGQAGFYRQIAQMDQHYTDEIRPLLDRIRCPVHILWGEQDTWIPITRGCELHALIPGSSFTPIAEAGHLVQEDAPEALVAVLGRVLGAH